MVKKKDKKKEEDPKIAESVLEGIGSIIPGLSKLFKEVAKTDKFKTRLKEVNKELQEKLKGRPLKKGDIKVEGGWKMKPILGDKKHAIKVVKKKIRPTQPRNKGLTDIFDEKGMIRVITQLDIPSKDLKVKAEKKILKVYKKNKVVKTIRLPKAVKHVIKKNYKNQILTVELKK
ncbi:MAG: hypothetical protein KKA79_02335 [Nanoarchaeota archaeon]|nr:hypothetical protein [Nanoarchaeota archaeon]MCG2717504.1 hypothetical protein [Nanoarchaeota archaeon]